MASENKLQLSLNVQDQMGLIKHPELCNHKHQKPFGTPYAYLVKQRYEIPVPKIYYNLKKPTQHESLL
jgi:hypothetical protein